MKNLESSSICFIFIPNCSFAFSTNSFCPESATTIFMFAFFRESKICWKDFDFERTSSTFVQIITSFFAFSTISFIWSEIFERPFSDAEISSLLIGFIPSL